MPDTSSFSRIHFNPSALSSNLRICTPSFGISSISFMSSDRISDQILMTRVKTAAEVQREHASHSSNYRISVVNWFTYMTAEGYSPHMCKLQSKLQSKCRATGLSHHIYLIRFAIPIILHSGNLTFTGNLINVASVRRLCRAQRDRNGRILISHIPQQGVDTLSFRCLANVEARIDITVVCFHHHPLSIEEESGCRLVGQSFGGKSHLMV